MIVAVTFVLLTASILFFPTVKICGRKIGLYWVIALLGAIILVVFSLAPISKVWQNLTANTAINPLKILALFFSMTFLSVFLDETGLFRFLAEKAASGAKTSQISLFFILYLLTAILTVFTSNDIVILTLTPFICFFCKNAEIDPVPYLVGEFAAANTWSMMLIIGNPTNIYLGTFAGITFTEYFKVMALPTVLSGIAELAVILLLFYKKLKKPLSPYRGNAKIESKANLIIGLIHIFICIIFLIISEFIGVEMWFVSVICAASLLLSSTAAELFAKNKRKYLLTSVSRLPFQLIPFFISMAVIVVCLDHQGISQKLGEFLGNSATLWTYGGASFIIANLINNIPMSILFSALPIGLPQTAYYRAIYASIVGSNIGAFLTPIGALAGIMFTELTDRYNVKYGFTEFIKYGAIVSLPTLAVAILSLSFVI